MHRPQEQVREFHRAIGQELSPDEPMIRKAALRASLIIEEAMETAFALMGSVPAYNLAQKILLDLSQKSARGEISDRPNIAEAIDGCIDTLYVVYGTMETIGVDAEPFFDEVQRANMAKANGPVREDGKRLKPEGLDAAGHPRRARTRAVGGVVEEVALGAAKVLTFYDEESEAEMELVSVSETGLCKCLYRNAHEGIEVRVARHRSRLRPLNDAAREMLKVTDTSTEN